MGIVSKALGTMINESKKEKLKKNTCFNMLRRIT